MAAKDVSATNGIEINGEKVETLSAEEQEKLIASIEKESNVRRFTGIPDILIKIILVAFAVYVYWATLIANLPEQVRRCIFLGSLVFIGYLIYPARAKYTKRLNHIAWYDFILAIVGASPFFYFAINFTAIVNRAVLLNNTDITMAVIGILCLAELTRRVVGFPILIVDALFLIYAFATDYSLPRIVQQLFYTTEGIIGTPIGVCSTFIVLFIFLAAFLEKSGIAGFFIDLANSVAGWASGGPAKVAVISSALMGMFSGSSVANTVGSGSVTIPVMKKTGYRPEFAGAVEAAASTGGQIMPPIMGAAAFLMAEITGVKYSTIAVKAILPAVLYFTGVFLMVHFEAKKTGLRGIPKDQIPNFFKLFAHKGYLFLPIVVLVGGMSWGMTPSRAACYGILTVLIVSFFSKSTRFTPTSFLDAVCAGSRNTLSVSLACGMAGIVIGVVTMTGLGQILVGMLMKLASHSLFLALFLTMISCIILGMGIPTTANYLIMALITAPMVISVGKHLGIVVPLLSAHMFVFYFGIVADITPPVALAAYAGSAIAHANPMKTGLNATRLAIAAFIIPYMFIYSPQMLFINATAMQVVQVVITSILGMFGLATGLIGYMWRRMHIIERLACIAGGLLLIKPGTLTDIIGLALIALVFAIEYIGRRKMTVQVVK